MDSEITLRTTLFQIDDHELFMWAAALPKGKQRRRALILQVLRAGIHAMNHPVAPVPNQQVNAVQIETSRRDTPSGKTTLEESHLNKDAEPATKNVAEKIESSDLDEIFGVER